MRALGTAVALAGSGCAPPAPVDTAAVEVGAPALGLASPFSPLPQSLPLDPRRVALGERLFADRRLSRGGDRACVDCHVLEAGGIAPAEARSNHPLDDGGPYNVPTVFNVAFQFRLNWQGGFPDLETHVGGPMMNPAVMDAGSWPELVGRLAPYDQDFRAAGYEGGVDEAAVRSALADYQRSLVTPDAPFDRFLRGEQELSPEAAAGFALFVELGCASCHQGRNIGGNLFQRYGVLADAYGGRALRDGDRGRAALTGSPDDERVFRVPSLRNVAATAPYFHDGSVGRLEDAVSHMADVQLGLALEEGELRSLVAFLETLTGTWKGAPVGSGSP